MRAVYRDMLTLHEALLEVEGRHATPEELELVHSARYVDEVRRAAGRAEAAGATQQFGTEGRVSGASWDAARAAVGCALAAIDSVRDGRARNAFCAVRPPGRDARADAPGRFSLFNTVAAAAAYLRTGCGAERVLVVDWGATAPLGTGEILAPDSGVRLVSIHGGSPSFPAGAGAAAPAGDPHVIVPQGASGAAFLATQNAALDRASAAWTPDWVLLGAGFDILAGDPLGGLSVAPADVYDLTQSLQDRADRWCGGRLISVLEGGYAPALTGRAVVQQLRALAGLSPA